MPTVCHAPFGELAVEDGALCSLAVHVIHPDLPCACEERRTQLLSGDSGSRKEKKREYACKRHDHGLAGPAGGFSNLVEAIFPLLYLECIYDLWLSFL